MVCVSIRNVEIAFVCLSQKFATHIIVLMEWWYTLGSWLSLYSWVVSNAYNIWVRTKRSLIRRPQ